MKTRNLLTIALVLIATTSALHAQQTVADAQQYLQKFVGNWVAKNASVEMDGNKSSVEYHADFKAAAGGTGLTMHEWFSAEGLGNYIGENIVGYDPNTATIHWYSTDNTGTCHDHYGFWSNPNHLFVQYNGVVDKKMYVEQLDMEFVSPTRMHVKVTGMTNGTTNLRIEGTFEKVQ